MSFPTGGTNSTRTKRLVLITQGTVANWDLGQLVGPALVGLAEEKDLILLVTTGGQADRIHSRTDSLRTLVS